TPLELAADTGVDEEVTGGRLFVAIHAILRGGAFDAGGPANLREGGAEAELQYFIDPGAGRRGEGQGQRADEVAVVEVLAADFQLQMVTPVARAEQGLGACENGVVLAVGPEE